ncbi:MAG: hypothetical protein POELPBGB_01689 [Bacteroidia bacterium]|nr:hypothetical protein [Bacteroidia bacterium]
MKNDIEQPWVEAGFTLFANDGPAGLKVDTIARKVGISRSSFYHHFADLDVFQEKMLTYHTLRSQRAIEKLKRCTSIDPDLLLAIVEEKEYVLFNRQLRVNRHIPAYKAAFEKAITLESKAIIGAWAQLLSLEQAPEVAENIYRITADIFFHRLTAENINYSWLQVFLKEIIIFISEIKTKSLPDSNSA